ncbi:MAG: hypothetical protein WB471_06295 [Nocardioides sp.]
MRVFILSFTLWALVGCGEAVSSADPDAPEVVAASEREEIRIVDEAEADLILYVSNQSFEDDEVRITVAVDGVTVVDDDFAVEGQHNWVQFPLAMPPGPHEVSAESDSGSTLTKSFETPGAEPRYAVIDHWTTRNGSGDLDWRFQRQPLAFA